MGIQEVLSTPRSPFPPFHEASPAKTAGRALLASLPEPVSRPSGDSPGRKKNGPAAGVTLQIHRRGVMW
jgi:hypothetical protein